MRRAPMHRFVARKPAASQFPIGKVGLLLPALMMAALVAPSARAIDLGVKTGAAVQAGPVHAGVSTATDARATTGAAHDSGARAAGETGNQIAGTARALRDTTGGSVRRAGHDTQSLTAAAQARADAAGAINARDRGNAAQTRTDARIGAQGSLQANDRARAAVDANARASANSAIGDSGATVTPSPEEGER